MARFQVRVLVYTRPGQEWRVVSTYDEEREGVAQMHASALRAVGPRHSDIAAVQVLRVLANPEGTLTKTGGRYRPTPPQEDAG